jgi:ParB-like chromosome segregation protein Spo0J
MESLNHLIIELKKLDVHERIEAINEVKKALHDISPMQNEPTDCILWVKSEDVIANDYNPNAVAPPEMKLLHISIEEDGFTQPIVVFPEEDKFTVVDGFHRNRVAREYEDIKERLLGYLPVTIIRDDREDRGDRIASTIRHNRARGKHKISAMSDIVIELKRRFWTDEKIGRELGMDADEVLRLTQITGLAEMFADRDFSEAWEAQETQTINETDNLELEDENK